MNDALKHNLQRRSGKSSLENILLILRHAYIFILPWRSTKIQIADEELRFWSVGDNSDEDLKDVAKSLDTRIIFQATPADLTVLGRALNDIVISSNEGHPSNSQRLPFFSTKRTEEVMMKGLSSFGPLGKVPLQATE